MSERLLCPERGRKRGAAHETAPRRLFVARCPHNHVVHFMAAFQGVCPSPAARPEVCPSSCRLSTSSVPPEHGPTSVRAQRGSEGRARAEPFGPVPCALVGNPLPCVLLLICEVPCVLSTHVIAFASPFLVTTDVLLVLEVPGVPPDHAVSPRSTQCPLTELTPFAPVAALPWGCVFPGVSVCVAVWVCVHAHVCWAAQPVFSACVDTFPWPVPGPPLIVCPHASGWAA